MLPPNAGRWQPRNRQTSRVLDAPPAFLVALVQKEVAFQQDRRGDCPGHHAILASLNSFAKLLDSFPAARSGFSEAFQKREKVNARGQANHGVAN